MSISKFKAKNNLEILNKLFLKEDVVYISDASYVMDSIDYARKVFDSDKNYLGQIRDRHFVASIRDALIIER